MTKDEALAKAADAVQMMHVAHNLYGEGTEEFDGATEAARSTFLVARAHGATDDDLWSLRGTR